RIRNIGIIAHIDAGKTTVTERMLFYSGFTKTIGEVHDGDTVMDYMQQERDRGITIQSAAISFQWKQHRINLIDTPGHIDFTVEVERALRVLDGAVAVFDAVSGVQAQTFSVWRQADRYRVPRIAFINKMDRNAADFEMTLQSIKEKLRVQPLVTQLPVGQGATFSGIVDLPTMQLITWDSSDCEHGSTFNSRDIKETDDLLWENSQQARSELVEQLAELDDDILNVLLQNDDMNHELLSSEEITSAIARVTKNIKAIPVLCGSALKNKGIQPLMNRITEYLPSPVPENDEISAVFGDNLFAYAFKVIYDRQRGPLVFLRIYSGNLKSRQSIFNATRSCREQVNRLLLVFADDYQEIKSTSVGNIAVAVGLKQTATGDILVSSASAAATTLKKAESKEDSAIIPSIKIPEPVFFCTIEPHTSAEQKALDHALSCLQLEDPSLKVTVNEDTGQTVLSGMGELHLEIIGIRIKEEFNVNVDLGPLQVSYREKITSNLTEQSKLDRILNGKRHTAAVTLAVESLTEAEPVICTRGSNLQLSDEYFESIRNSIIATSSHGPILSFPVIGIKVSVINCEIQVGTLPSIIAACASNCLQQIFSKSVCRLLEPVMKIEVQCFDKDLQSVLADLSKNRRANINEVNNKDEIRTILAEAPLETLVGYATALRSMTSGTGSFTTEYSKYSLVPSQQQELLLSKRRY
ncbi:uncharacterized protein TRIADDRAFT_22097, partial [Trichoplax adhaerens]